MHQMPQVKEKGRRKGRTDIFEGGAFMAKVQLNTQAPEFTLKDVHKNAVSLSDFAGKKNVLLVFNRGFV